MSDDPAPSADTPAPEAAPQEGHAVDDQSNWQERYENLRSEFNRRDQEISQLRQYEEVVQGLTNPETQAQYLEALNLQLQDDGQQPPQGQEYVDPWEQRFNTLEQQLQQLGAHAQQQQEAVQQQEREMAMNNHFGSQVHEIQTELGRELSDQELNAMASYAYMNLDGQGLPDGRGAWDMLQGLQSNWQQEWVSSKRAPSVPDGQAAGKDYDLSTAEGKEKYMLARLAELDEDRVQT